MEKRNFSRVEYDVAVTLEYQGELFASEILNLSLHGALINTSASLSLGQNVSLSFHLAQPDNPITIQCAGKIVRVDEFGVGLEFTEIDFDSFADLRHIIAFNTGNPELVDQEFSKLVQNKTQASLDQSDI